MAPQMTKGLTARGPIEKPKQNYTEEYGPKRPICNRCANGKHPYSKCKSREWEWAGHSDADAKELETDHCNRHAKELFNIHTNEAKEKFMTEGTYRKGTKPPSTTSVLGPSRSHAGAVENSGPQNKPVTREAPSDAVSDVRAATLSEVSITNPTPQAESSSGPRPAPLPTDSARPTAKSEASGSQSAPPESSLQSSPVPANVASARPSAVGPAPHSARGGGLDLSQQESGPAPKGEEKSGDAQDAEKYPNYSKLTDATYAQTQPAGRVGKELLIRTNFFRIEQLPKVLYRYSITYAQMRGRDVKNKTVKFELISELFGQQPSRALPSHLATDWNNLLISTRQLYDPQVERHQIEQTHQVPFRNQSQTVPQLHEVKIKPLASQQPNELWNYVNGGGNADCSEVVTALNIICQRRLATEYVPVGRGRYFEKLNVPTEDTRAQWSHGLHPRSGFVYSIRPSHGMPLLNVNVAATAFHNRMKLIDLIGKHFPGLDESTELGANQVKDLRTLICGLRARVMYQPPDHTKDRSARGVRLPLDQIESLGRSKRMNTLGDTVARQRFNHSIFGTLTVQRYFNNYVLPLRFPNLPAINVGGVQEKERVWIPPELLWIEPHQPFRGKLPSLLVASMIQFVRKGPSANAQEIATKGVNILGTQSLRNGFGLTIRDRLPHQNDGSQDALVQLQGRFLPVPALRYQVQFTPDHHGQWDLRQKRFLMAQQLGVLDVIGVGGLPGLDGICRSLVNGFRAYGIGLAQGGSPVNVTNSPSTSEAHLDQALERLKAQRRAQRRVPVNPTLVLVVIKDRNTLAYADIKRWGDAIVGVPTVVCTLKKLQSDCGRGPYQGNIALKMNINLRGRNHSLIGDSYTRLRNSAGEGSTMIVGADVTHPGVGSLKHCPSVAAVVASIDEQHTTYPGSVRLQASRQEIISELDTMVAERLRCWGKHNGKRLPDSILFYRDGVSESQFALVKNYELRLIKQGCAMAGAEYGEPNYEPKITLVTVGKRHQTRFYPLKGVLAKDMESHAGNFKPGLVVDTVVTSPYHFDFYLQSHGARQGTARNGHYFVLENGMNLSADELQGLTYKLCWLYARSVTAVSYVTPAYYADKLCDRARCWLLPMLTNRYSVIPVDKDNDADVLAIASSNHSVWPLRPGRKNPWHENLDEMMFYL